MLHAVASGLLDTESFVLYLAVTSSRRSVFCGVVSTYEQQLGRPEGAQQHEKVSRSQGPGPQPGGGHGCGM